MSVEAAIKQKQEELSKMLTAIGIAHTADRDYSGVYIHIDEEKSTRKDLGQIE